MSWDESNVKLQSAEVRKSIRLLKAKGVSLEDIEKAYSYFNKPYKLDIDEFIAIRDEFLSKS